MIKSIDPYFSTKRHPNGRCLFKTYKAYNPGMAWQFGTLNKYSIHDHNKKDFGK